jgi:hypothetical protein
VAGQQSGLDLLSVQAFMKIRWTLSKRLSIFILSIVGIGAIVYNYLMQFKDIKFDSFDDEEDKDDFED